MSTNTIMYNVRLTLGKITWLRDDWLCTATMPYRNHKPLITICAPRRHDGMLLRPNPLPKWSPSAHVAQVEMSRGTLPCLIQTGEGFLLTFDLGCQDANDKNNHGIGQINHGPTTEWINHGARPQKLQTTSWNVLLRLVAGLRHCGHVE